MPALYFPVRTAEQRDAMIGRTISYRELDSNRIVEGKVIKVEGKHMQVGGNWVNSSLMRNVRVYGD